MQIVQKGYSKTYFGDVEIGKAFCISGFPIFYMRVEDVDNECGDTCHNAVNLESGELALFSDDDKVDILKATLMIE